MTKEQRENIIALETALMSLYETVYLSERLKSEINDEIDEITVGLFKQKPDGDYQEKLHAQGFTVTYARAMANLSYLLETACQHAMEFYKHIFDKQCIIDSNNKITLKQI